MGDFTACENCAAGTAGSDGICITCGTGKTDKDDFTACENCAAGTAGSGGTCITCGTGKTNKDDFTTCENCAAGKAGTDGTCADCTAGTMSAAAVAASACTDCAAGKQQPASGQTSCYNCGAGKISHHGYATCINCAAGQTSGDEFKTCVDCAVGKTGRAGTDCTELCAAGSTSDYGATACSNCAAGTTSTKGGTPNSELGCTNCAAGKTSRPPSICTNCAVGKTGAAGTDCATSCIAGKTASNGATTCSFCAAGTISAAESTDGCTDCFADAFSVFPFIACTDCTMPTGAAITATGYAITCTSATTTRIATAINTAASKCNPSSFFTAGGVDTADTCTRCNTVDHALAGTTHTCTSKTNQVIVGKDGTASVNKCAAGYYWVEPLSGSFDPCAPCSSVTGAAARATYTCTTAFDSRVSDCDSSTPVQTEGQSGVPDTCSKKAGLSPMHVAFIVVAVIVIGGVLYVWKHKCDVADQAKQRQQRQPTTTTVDIELQSNPMKN